MSGYIARCEKCGAPFEARPRRKLALLSETGPGKFTSGGWARYYCPKCAADVREAVDRAFRLGGVGGGAVRCATCDHLMRGRVDWCWAWGSETGVDGYCHKWKEKRDE